MKLIYTAIFSFFIIATNNAFSQTSHTGINDTITALELSREMSPGVNLWNTLDAHGSWVSGLATETMWGHPYTTQAITDFIAERGFKTLRVPTTWYNHMGPAPDYKIDDEWMDRVETVINFSLNSGMYTILNIHHDDYKKDKAGSWLIPTYEKKDQNTDQLVKVWTQIAERFKDYGDSLLFETMNEPRVVGHSQEWTGGTTEHREVINAYNLAAVNAIRQTGGNNSKRFIMIPQVGANPASAIENMVIPNNDDKIIISVHRYHPYNFCQNDNGTDQWGTTAEKADLESGIKALNQKFVSKGQAVILGEWGAKDKGNYAERVNYYKAYSDICKKWDVGNICWMYTLDRKSLKWQQPLIEEAILQAYNPSKINVANISIEMPKDTINAGETLQLSATVLPDTATYKSVIWTSYNKNIASVDENGLVTAHAEGYAIMSATTIGAQKRFKVIVTNTSTHTSFKIEAETFEKQTGLQQGACSDEGGGQNIGYIENNDWSSYRIRIDTAGVYNLTFRAATETDGGIIEVSIDNKNVTSVSIDGDKSNGWQDWYTTGPIELELTEGEHEIKLTFKGGGGYLFNINWFKLDYIGAKVNTGDFRPNSNQFHLYPNPAKEILYVFLPGNPSKIELYTLDGTLVYSAVENSNEKQINVSKIKKGTYVFRVTSGNRSYVKKILIE